MNVLRAAAATTAALIITTPLLLGVAGAADDAMTRMPVIPDLGASTNEQLPPVKGLDNAGRSVGGVDAARLERSMRAAKASASNN